MYIMLKLKINILTKKLNKRINTKKTLTGLTI